MRFLLRKSKTAFVLLKPNASEKRTQRKRIFFCAETSAKSGRDKLLDGKAAISKSSRPQYHQS
jgi:hypothetical protein